MGFVSSRFLCRRFFFVSHLFCVVVVAFLLLRRRVFLCRRFPSRVSQVGFPKLGFPSWVFLCRRRRDSLCRRRFPSWVSQVGFPSWVFFCVVVVAFFVSSSFPKLGFPSWVFVCVVVAFFVCRRRCFFCVVVVVFFVSFLYLGGNTPLWFEFYTIRRVFRQAPIFLPRPKVKLLRLLRLLDYGPGQKFDYLDY